MFRTDQSNTHKYFSVPFERAPGSKSRAKQELYVCIHTCQVLKVRLRDVAKKFFDLCRGDKDWGMLLQKSLKIECLRLDENATEASCNTHRKKSFRQIRK